MKSQERHKLKSNELAETLKEIPHWLRTQGSRVITVAAIGLIVLAAVLWVVQNSSQAHAARLQQLQGLLAQNQSLINQAVQWSRDEKNLQARPYDSAALVNQLEAISQGEGSGSVGVMARLEQAKALRLELLMASRDITDQEKKQICDQARALYQNVIDQAAKNPMALGQAMLGKALIEEDSDQFDQARQTYQQIIDLKDDQLAGTVYPIHAQNRLDRLPEIQQTLTFLPAPPEALEQQPDPMKDKISVISPTSEEKPQPKIPTQPDNQQQQEQDTEPTAQPQTTAPDEPKP